jgi:hypothetical protein
VIFVHVFVMPAGQKSAALGTAASLLKLSLEAPAFQQASVPAATTVGRVSMQLPDFWEQDPGSGLLKQIPFSQHCIVRSVTSMIIAWPTRPLPSSLHSRNFPAISGLVQ